MATNLSLPTLAELVRRVHELERRCAQLEHENRLLWPLVDFRGLCVEGFNPGDDPAMLRAKGYTKRGET